VSGFQDAAATCKQNTQPSAPHHYAHHQELKSIMQWLLPVVFRAVVFKLLFWCGAEGYVCGLQDAAGNRCRCRERSVGIATSLRTGRSVDRIPVPDEIFLNCPHRCWSPLKLLLNGCQVSFPGIELPGLSINEFKGRVQLYLYSPSGPSWPVLG